MIKKTLVFALANILIEKNKRQIIYNLNAKVGTYTYNGNTNIFEISEEKILKIIKKQKNTAKVDFEEIGLSPSDI